MRKSAILLMLLSGLFLSCTVENPSGGGEASLNLDRDSISFAPDPAAGSLQDTLTIRCNRSWSAVVQYDGTPASSEEWICLSQEEDSNLSDSPRTFRIVVSASENEYPVGRSAVLSFFYEGNVKEVPISQPRFIQRISIDRELTPDTTYPNADSLGIVFISNDSWTAELSNAFPGASLSSKQGAKGSGCVYLRTGRNIGAVPERRATIVLRNGPAADSITVTQDSWRMTEALFSDGTALVSKDLWPFTYPKSSDLGSSAKQKSLAGQRVECTMRDGSASFFVQSADGLWRNSKQGFDFTCSDDADGLELPAVDSLRLAAVELVTGYAKKDMMTSIRDASNIEVEGGEGFVFTSVGESHCWYLPSGGKGALLKLWAPTVMMREIRVYYED